MHPSENVIATLFGLISLAIGLILLLYGLFAVTICVYSEGCRPEITWPLVVGGLALISIGTAGVLWKGTGNR